MIRVLVYLVIVALLAFGAVWFAERPGDVVITWQGRRIDTSVMVLLAAVAGADRGRLRRRARRQEIHRRGRAHRAARAAHAAAERPDGAALRRPRRGGRDLPGDGGPRRHPRARPA